METEVKRLYRSDRNRVFAGICGGLGEYLNVDPVLLRLIWLLVVIFTGVVPGLVAYIIGIFIIPRSSTHPTAH
jgi:phage shock protein PspC (stress-responsive transcriptional regulator)